MTDFGAWSLVPPVAAIILAIATRRVVLSLLVGVCLGAFIEAFGNPVDAVVIAGEGLIWNAIAGEDGSNHLRVFAFSLLMGAMVGVIHRIGAMRSAVETLLPLARSRRSAQFVGWCMGMIVFFDDYANTLLLGNALRPLFDRLKISREKLAYLVDSTAAPVAGLALISTWVAGEIGYIDEGLGNVAQAAGDNGAFVESADGMSLFIASIPYRFYVLLALVFVPMVALLNRDFGPMLTAEQRAANQTPEKVADPNHTNRKTAPWFAAIVPIVVMVSVVIALIFATGYSPPEDEQTSSITILMNTFGNSDSYIALVYGSLAGLVTAIVFAVCYRFSSGVIMKGIRAGALAMVPALAILWLAWSLSTVTNAEHLKSAEYLKGLLAAAVPVWLLPTIVFLLASIVAFCTGTSWGTMAILTPLVIETAWKLLAPTGEPINAADPVFVGSIGSVLAGAIFGDHCSPISDTTVLSSQSSGCDHIAHVRTQLPYALLAAVVAILAGTLPIGFGVSPYLCLPVGLILMLACLLIFGKRVIPTLDS